MNRKNIKKIIIGLLLVFPIFIITPISYAKNNYDVISGYMPEKGSTGYDYIYLGKINDNPIKWRVLSSNGNTTGENDFLQDDDGSIINNEQAFYILTENIIDIKNKPLQSDNFQTSDLKEWCLSVMENNTDIYFSETEKKNLLQTTKSDDEVALVDASLMAVDNELNGDKIFFLSGDEVLNESYGFAPNFAAHDSRIAYYNDTPTLWMIRQPLKTTSKLMRKRVGTYVSSVGDLGSLTLDENTGLRPAANFDKSSILFLSPSDSGKSVFGKTEENKNHEWKLTLKDGNNFSDATIDSTVSAPNKEIIITHKGLAEISSDYTNLTAAISDKDGNLLYYGSVDTDVNATETKITIPSDLADGSYTLAVYGEDWNGDKFTDYATGTPFETELTIDSKAVAASDAINKIPATDKITLSDKAAIEAARKAYDALTDKSKVSAEDLKKLTGAETKLAELQKAADAQKATTTAKPATTVAEPATKPVVKVGKKVTVGNLKYKVTSVKAKSRTVTVTGMKNKKKIYVKIPATININKVSYKVTAVANNAFKGNKKLKTVVIGKNVKTIGKYTFKNCKNLKKITVNTKVLKKVGTGSLKGINKKAVVKVPAKKRKAYKKLFNKKGQAKTVIIK